MLSRNFVNKMSNYAMLTSQKNESLSIVPQVGGNTHVCKGKISIGIHKLKRLVEFQTTIKVKRLTSDLFSRGSSFDIIQSHMLPG